jgi:alpha-tubulin suppressor-like RCC1 family protein
MLSKKLLGIQKVAAGGGGSPTSGPLYTWGANRGGAGTPGILGDGTNVNKSSPVQIGSSSWTAISMGLHTLAIRSDGKLFAWGPNSAGQLGDGTVVNKSSPVQIGSSSWTAVATAAGNQGASSWAIRSDGKLFAWGDNTYGCLGNGTTTGTSSPIQIGASSWTAIAAGMRVVSAIRSDGKLFTWGDGGYGKLGDGTASSKSSPVQIGTSSWTAVSRGGGGTGSAAAIRSDGKLFTWGYAAYGALGNGDIVTNKSSPVQIGTSSWTAVSTGGNWMLGITSDKRLFSWGSGGGGQLGTGSTAMTSSPVQVGTSSWTAVAGTGAGHSAAIRLDGALFTWGDNAEGQLGRGNSGSGTATSSPVQVGSGSWIAVTAGYVSTGGITV